MATNHDNNYESSLVRKEEGLSLYHLKKKKKMLGLTERLCRSEY